MLAYFIFGLLFSMIVFSCLSFIAILIVLFKAPFVVRALPLAW